MSHNDSATARRWIALPARERGGTAGPWRGLLLASLGVTAFSLTFPATAWALEGLGPWTVTSARVALAALLACGWLAVARVPRPERRHRVGLLVVAAGVVIGFPLLTTLALRTAGASHAAVVTGLLPLTTACYATLRRRSAPGPGPAVGARFWVPALAGAAVVAGFTVHVGGGAPTTADLYLFAALLLCAAAYGEGARLARELPGWQVACWALVPCLPLALAGLVAALVAEPAPPGAGVAGVRVAAGLLWLAVGSQLLGLAAWHRGLALAGTARASQLQLAQPLLTLAWAAALLGERLTWATGLAALGVLLSIALTQRAAATAPRRAADPRLENT